MTLVRDDFAVTVVANVLLVTRFLVGQLWDFYSNHALIWHDLELTHPTGFDRGIALTVDVLREASLGFARILIISLAISRVLKSKYLFKSNCLVLDSFLKTDHFLFQSQYFFLQILQPGRFLYPRVLDGE
jgi:hypothetical protein